MGTEKSVTKYYLTYQGGFMVGRQILDEIYEAIEDFRRNCAVFLFLFFYLFHSFESLYF